MTDDQFRSDAASRFVDDIKNGRMTRRQLLVRASALGLSLTAAGSFLAACGGDSGTTASPSASGAPAPVMGGSLIGVIPPSLESTGKCPGAERC